MNRKGMNAAIVIIVALVVMLVTAMLVSSYVRSSVYEFSGSSDETIHTSALSIRCQAELVARCHANATGCICAACRSCPVGVMCP